MVRFTVTGRNVQKCITTDKLPWGGGVGKYRSAGKSQWEGNSLCECLLLYGLIQGFSNHFIIASLLNRRLTCWHLSICSCQDHLPSPFATALHSCDILEEQCRASNIFYLMAISRAETMRRACSLLLTITLCRNWYLWTKLKTKVIVIFWFPITDRGAQKELPLYGTLPTSAVTAYGQLLWTWSSWHPN